MVLEWKRENKEKLKWQRKLGNLLKYWVWDRDNRKINYETNVASLTECGIYYQKKEKNWKWKQIEAARHDGTEEGLLWKGQAYSDNGSSLYSGEGMSRCGSSCLFSLSISWR